LNVNFGRPLPQSETAQWTAISFNSGYVADISNCHPLAS
jgi:hypothetical protein